MKSITLLKILGVAFAAGVSWGGATMAAKQELKGKVDNSRFVAESAKVATQYERAMWEIRSDLRIIADLTKDNTNRLREICLELKAGCR